MWLAGVIIEPDGVVASDVAEWHPYTNPPMYPYFLPDLDLHVYTQDGRHVGMNYASGEYEAQVEGAITSGNLMNSHEWILLPKGTPFKYVVRSASTAKFLEENPDAAMLTTGMDSYSVHGLISDPVNGFITSTTLQEDITSGQNLEHPVVINSEGTTIEIQPAQETNLPLDLSVAVQAPTTVKSRETISYLLSYGNTGGTPGTEVLLKIKIPNEAGLVSAEGFLDIGNNEYLLSIPSMDILKSQMAIVTVQLPDDLHSGEEVEFTAQIGDDGLHGQTLYP